MKSIYICTVFSGSCGMWAGLRLSKVPLAPSQVSPAGQESWSLAQGYVTADLLARTHQLTGLPVAVGKSGLWLNWDSMETLIWVFPCCPAAACHETCRNVMSPETSAPLSGLVALVSGFKYRWGNEKRFSGQAVWPIFFPSKKMGWFPPLAPNCGVLRNSWW